MSKQPLLPEASQSEGRQPSDAAYPVGYCRTPVHTRYRPGQSGNKKGRPKRHRNTRTVVEEILNQKIKIRVGNEICSRTNFEAFVLTIMTGALNRDAKAQASLLALLRQVGMMDDVPEANHAEPFTANDDIILADYLRRCGVGSRRPDDPQDKGGSTAAPTSPGGRAES